MKKGRNKARILKNQKINKKRFSFPFKASLIITIILLVLGVVLASFTDAIDITLDKSRHQFSVKAKSSGDHQVDKLIRQKLSNKAFDSLEDVKKFAIDLQHEIAASRVHLFRIKPTVVSIRYEFFQPVAAVQLGSGKLVNSAGKVFGSFSETKHSHLPYLKGLEIVKKLRYLEDQSLTISEKNSRLIQESLLLINTGMRYNIRYKTILFDPYRGFSALLRDKRIRVEMGRSPFEKKYKKLEKILASLEKKRVTAARIELDFKGKAFVKEF